MIGKNTVQAKEWLDKHHKGSAPSASTVKYWFAEFKRGRTEVDDEARSGRPKEVVTPENIEKVHQIVMGNRKVKLQEIADTLKISKDRVHLILH